LKTFADGILHITESKQFIFPTFRTTNYLRILTKESSSQLRPLKLKYPSRFY